MSTEDRAWTPRGKVVVVADASESAAAYWPQIAQTIGALLHMNPQVYVLGCDTPLVADRFVDGTAGFPHQQARHCSLIAPILEDLSRRYQPVDALIVVGSGPIWDLADWLGSPLVGQWLLLRAGPDSLQTDDLAVREYEAGELKQALARLRRSLKLADERRPAQDSFWTSVGQTWDVDRAGFPLVYIEPMRAFVHLFPGAKAQFERYLWQQNPSEWADTRYEELLVCNPRAAPGQLWSRPYEQIFLTGIVPTEVSAFARWLGRGYELLDLDEWRTACRWLKTQKATPVPPDLSAQGLSTIAQQIWQALLAETEAQTLLDLSLMVGGVLEWTYDAAVARPAKRHVGMGLPRSSFLSTAKALDKPLHPIDPTRRMRYFGFRLKRRR